MDLSAKLLQCREMNPERPPNWRWERAVILSDRDTATRSIDDDFIKEVVKFHKDLKTKEDEELYKKYGPLYQCHYFWFSNSLTKSLLEAYILSDTDKSVIAENFGWSTDESEKVIDIYEKLFFDVRSRLKFDPFILANVIKLTEHYTLPTDDQIYKMLAYVGYKKKIGPLFLQAYVNMDSMDEKSAAWFNSFIREHITRKTARSLFRHDPAYNEGLRQLIDVYTSTQKFELDKAIKGSDEVKTSELEERMVNALKISAAGVKDRLDSPIVLSASEEIAEAINNQIIEQTKSKKKEDTKQ